VSERAVAAVLQQDGSVDQAISVDVTMNMNTTGAAEDAGQPCPDESEIVKIKESIFMQVDRKLPPPGKFNSRAMESAVAGVFKDEIVQKTRGEVSDKIALWYHLLTQAEKMFPNKEKAFVYACYFVQWFSEGFIAEYSYQDIKQAVVIEATKKLNRKIYDSQFRHTTVYNYLEPVGTEVIGTYETFRKHVKGYYAWNPNVVLTNGKNANERVADLDRKYKRRHGIPTTVGARKAYTSFREGVMQGDLELFKVN
jgi:hypothetical protein